MRNKIIAFDMDDVLCCRTSDEGAVDKYYTCKPIPEMIAVVNQCYDAGAQITVYTARGMASYRGCVSDVYHNLYQLTKKQLSDWGVKYHKLVMGKIQYDLLIDDKAVSSVSIKSVAGIEGALNTTSEFA